MYRLSIMSLGCWRCGCGSWRGWRHGHSVTRSRARYARVCFSRRRLRSVKALSYGSAARRANLSVGIERRCTNWAIVAKCFGQHARRFNIRTTCWTNQAPITNVSTADGTDHTYLPFSRLTYCNKSVIGLRRACALVGELTMKKHKGKNTNACSSLGYSIYVQTHKRKQARRKQDKRKCSRAYAFLTLAGPPLE